MEELPAVSFLDDFHIFTAGHALLTAAADFVSLDDSVSIRMVLVVMPSRGDRRLALRIAGR